MEWPDWWTWEIELAHHVWERMIDRRFNEVDVHLMLEMATGFRDNHEEGRFVIEVEHEGRRWAVIVEPDATESVLVVVTAYPID